jgi:hypothetical protein
MDAVDKIKFNGWDGTPKGWPYIGTLKGFSKFTSSNTHDSATCKIHDKLISDGLIDTLYPVINSDIKSFGVATVGMGVQKCGRTTGYTTGKVIALHGEFTIGYNAGPIKFTDCIVTSSMSQGGDSGSVILDHNSNAVALLFAGSAKVTLAHPIKYVVDHYGLSIYSNEPGSIINNRTWVNVDGPDDECVIGPTGPTINVTSHSNNYAFAESLGSKFNEFYAEVYTGDDTGATWGPGIAVVWPDGTLKINLRHGSTFGASYLGVEYMACGRVKERTWYPMRISITDKVRGEVYDDGKWNSAIELPLGILKHTPNAFRIGKMDANGNASNHQDSGSKQSCAFRNYRVS